MHENFPKKERPIQGKYVVIGPNATAGCKEWKYEYWVTLTKLITQMGYQVVSLTKNEFHIDNTINMYNHPMENVANVLHHADLFIGLGSGLSWLNWALGKHSVMISGFTPKDHEFQTNITRIQNEHSCNSCWANPNFTFDGGDWHW